MRNKRKPDFSGWATKFNVRCSDGRTIKPEAFKNCEGMSVPLVWSHDHSGPSSVLGHALLHYRPPQGVYTEGFFNRSQHGQEAKEAVRNEDVTHLSIYANQLQHASGTRNVVHGMIREVSLVLAGANPGAIIDNPVLAHSGEACEDEARIYMNSARILAHSEKEVNSMRDYEYEDDEELDDEYDEEDEDFDDEDEDYDDEDEFEHGDYDDEDFDDEDEDYDDEDYDDDDYDDEDDDYDEDDEFEHGEDLTFGDVIDSMDEDQQAVLYYMIQQALENTGAAAHSDIYGGSDMAHHNIFEDDYEVEDGGFLSHDEMTEILKDAKHMGSLKQAFLAHADGDEEYGIRDIEWLFPDFTNVTRTPEWIKRPDGWVTKVMSGVHHVPFTRIRSMFADITEDEARAKGYIKGNFKKEEVFSLLKRSTTPTTVYKKQKINRDDELDITDFDVVAWLKTEMRMMLNEELARAYLIGDGRPNSSDDKIPEDHIRPIVNDASLFTIRYSVAGDTADLLAKNIIRASVKSRKNYKGSGRPTMFTTEDYLTDMLLLEDSIGNRMYKTEAELATACRVSEIVTVPVLEGFKDKDGKDVYAIIVNLNDYDVGADQGGAVSMFEDFDIDYNAEKYLIETRCSAALVKPFSAIVLRSGTANESEEPTMAEIRAEMNS